MPCRCCYCRFRHVQVVHSEMATWTACVVLFTLTVNAPFLGPLMTWLGLNKTTPAQRHMHRCGRARCFGERARCQLALMLAPSVSCAQSACVHGRVPHAAGLQMHARKQHPCTAAPLIPCPALPLTPCVNPAARRHAFAALAQYTEQTIADLQEDDDEMLRGVDWKAVAEGANLGMDAKRVLKSSTTARRNPSAPAEWQLAGSSRATTDAGASGGGQRRSVEAGTARSLDRSGSILLTRKSLSRLSASGARLGAPLLGGGRGRYGQAAEESDDEEGWADVEAGRQPRASEKVR